MLKCLRLGCSHQVTSVREYALKVISALSEKPKSSICISFVLRNKLEEYLIAEINYPHVPLKKGKLDVVQ